MAVTPNVTFGKINTYTDNPSAAGEPGISDDVTQGYTPGSRWYDVTNKRLYMCLDNSDGAAIWQQILGSGLAGTGTTAGTATTVKGALSVSATGGLLILEGGDATAGNNNGGDVSIGGGNKAGSGTLGNILIVNGPTANPAVNRALYFPSGAGAVSISGG